MRGRKPKPKINKSLKNQISYKVLSHTKCYLIQRASSAVYLVLGGVLFFSYLFFRYDHTYNRLI